MAISPKLQGKTSIMWNFDKTTKTVRKFRIGSRQLTTSPGRATTSKGNNQELVSGSFSRVPSMTEDQQTDALLSRHSRGRKDNPHSYRCWDLIARNYPIKRHQWVQAVGSRESQVRLCRCWGQLLPWTAWLIAQVLYPLSHHNAFMRAESSRSL